MNTDPSSNLEVTRTAPDHGIASPPPASPQKDDADSFRVDTYQALNHFQQLANDSIADAQTWVRNSSLARAIPEAIPDAILVLDEAGLIVSVNAQFELMFGYHRSHVIGQTPEMLLAPEFRQQHVALRDGFAQEPRVRDMGGKLSARRKNGAEIMVQIRLGPVVTVDGTFIIATIRRVRD